MLSAHYRLGQRRPPGESCVCVYPADDPAGFGPALQVVTDHGGMLMDSVTVLLHRLGVAYTAIMTPVFEVHRDPTGRAAQHRTESARHVGSTSARPGSTSSSSPSVDRKALAEVERLLPKVLTDVQRVASRRGSADRHPERPGRRVETNAGRPLFGAGPRGRRGAAALAGQRKFPAAGLPALPGARRSGHRRRVSRPGRAAQPHRFPSPADRRRQAAGVGPGRRSAATCATAPTRMPSRSAKTSATGPTALSSTASSGSSPSPP